LITCAASLIDHWDKFDDHKDNRPIIDWTQIMRQKAVVYVGLDALSDSTVAHAVGAAMFADLTTEHRQNTLKFRIINIVFFLP
jgi:hypothetical protein